MDQMNLQLDSENIISDSFNYLKSMIVQAPAEPKKEETSSRVNSTAIAEMKNLLSEAEKAPQKVEKKVAVQKPVEIPAKKPVEKPVEKKQE